MANNQRAQTMLKKIAAIAIGASVGLAMFAPCDAGQAHYYNLRIKDAVKYSNKMIPIKQISPRSIYKGTFSFTNISQNPLFIQSVKPNCSCVKVTYTNGPIASGAEGLISLTYNSQGDNVKIKSAYVNFKNVDGPILINFVIQAAQPR